MNDWFAVDKIDGDTFVIGEYKHWEETHCYLLCGTEKDWLSVKFPVPLQVVKNNLMYKPCDFPKNFVIDHYQIYQGVPQRILCDGDCLDLGNRQVIVLHTPGHSPGHCCFYEPERKYLYSGDLIYKGCLDAFYPSTDPQLFWQSVRKIQGVQREIVSCRVLPIYEKPFKIKWLLENCLVQ